MTCQLSRLLCLPAGLLRIPVRIPVRIPASIPASIPVSLLGALLLGCGNAPPTAPADPAPPGELADSQSLIIGGTPTTGDPAVVAIFGAKPGNPTGTLCTGTIISPTVVLTAAHCLDPSNVGAGLVYTVLTGPSIADATNPSPRLAVKETHFDPLFDHTKLLNGHDIGVVILQSPTAIPPLGWNADALPLTDKGQPVRIIGYGLNDVLGQKGSGIKRVTTVKLNDFDNLVVRTGDLTHTICNGDSGGPVLMRVGEVEKVIGVNSFGLAACLFFGNSTRVDTYASFIQPYL